MACAHQICDCTDANLVRGGQNYCSEACALAVETGAGEETCACGHPGCGGA